jgi:hypothetical protein
MNKYLATYFVLGCIFVVLAAIYMNVFNEYMYALNDNGGFPTYPLLRIIAVMGFFFYILVRLISSHEQLAIRFLSTVTIFFFLLLILIFTSHPSFFYLIAILWTIFLSVYCMYVLFRRYNLKRCNLKRCRRD